MLTSLKNVPHIINYLVRHYFNNLNQYISRQSYNLLNVIICLDSYKIFFFHKILPSSSAHDIVLLGGERSLLVFFIFKGDQGEALLTLLLSRGDGQDGE